VRVLVCVRCGCVSCHEVCCICILLISDLDDVRTFLESDLWTECPREEIFVSDVFFAMKTRDHERTISSMLQGETADVRNVSENLRVRMRENLSTRIRSTERES